MKLSENMDGVVIAAIAAAIVSGLMAAVIPAPKTIIAADSDNQVHTVVITGKRLGDS
ncbi:hypothetical protein ACO0LO_22510 [Undibacterium sp. TJN25]|uniref:hypothetical protein n=1 Tax=Undibacterium sp. TJN25 TaxID=3413056 RepID=UPI003BF14CE2